MLYIEEFTQLMLDMDFDGETDKALIQRCVNKGLFDANFLQKSIDLELLTLGRRIISEQQCRSFQTGIALTCGANRNNALGVNACGDQLKLVERFGTIKTADANWETCIIDTLDQLWVNGDKRLDGMIVKAATSGNLNGERSTAYYATDGEDKIWSWGHNDVGQLGNGTTTTCNAPSMIEALKDKSVKSMSVHGDAVACVTDANEAFVWGRCSAFGLGGKVTVPTKLDRRIESINVGRNHAMMMEANSVFSIGGNSCGELGVNDKARRNNWTKVEGLDDETIIAIECGAFCSAIMTAEAVYVMGKYIGGESGCVDKPTKINLVNIAKISLRAEHILAMNNEGNVYAWGANWSGRCGVDSSASMITKPTRVPMSTEYTVIDISAGEGHSIITVTK